MEIIHWIQQQNMHQMMIKMEVNMVLFIIQYFIYYSKYIISKLFTQNNNIAHNI